MITADDIIITSLALLNECLKTRWPQHREVLGSHSCVVLLFKSASDIVMGV